MRGNNAIFSSSYGSADAVQPSSTESSAFTPADGNSNVADNTALAVKPGSIWWAMLLLGLYIIYYWMYNVKWRDTISKDAVLAFLHDAFSISILAAVGINLINVFLTKLAALKIPFLSRVAGTFLPLFHL